jgi:hypothetical protein
MVCDGYALRTNCHGRNVRRTQRERLYETAGAVTLLASTG